MCMLLIQDWKLQAQFFMFEELCNVHEWRMIAPIGSTLQCIVFVYWLACLGQVFLSAIGEDLLKNVAEKCGTFAGCEVSQSVFSKYSSHKMTFNTVLRAKSPQTFARLSLRNGNENNKILKSMGQVPRGLRSRTKDDRVNVSYTMCQHDVRMREYTEASFVVNCCEPSSFRWLPGLPLHEFSHWYTAMRKSANARGTSGHGHLVEIWFSGMYDHIVNSVSFPNAVKETVVVSGIILYHVPSLIRAPLVGSISRGDFRIRMANISTWSWWHVLRIRRLLIWHVSFSSRLNDYKTSSPLCTVAPKYN